MVVDVERVERGLFGQPVLVDPDDHRLALIDARLLCRSSLFDQRLGLAGGDIGGHPARRIDLGDQFARLVHQRGGQRLDIIRPAQRIGDAGDAGFLLNHQLRVAGNPRGKIGRQRDRFIERVGVKRLGATEHRGQRLDRGADDVVIRVLLLQAHTGGLAMGAQHLGLFVLSAQPFHHLVPQRAGGAHLGDLHEEVHADAPEEAEARGKGVDIEPGGHRAAGIFLAVGDGEGQFLHRRRAGFVHVVARNRDAVEFRHMRRGVGDDVADDPHRRFGRVNIGVADHELLQNVVLNGSAELVLRHPLPFRRDDVERHHRDDRAVHGHADAHFVQRDLVEQHLHIGHGVDRHARLANIADHARMVAVIAAMGGKIECDRQPLLPGGEIAAVKGVRFLGGRKTGILADGPRPAGVHRGIGPARERGETRQARPLGRRIVRGIKRLDRDALRRVPSQIAALHFLVGGCLPVGLVHCVSHSGSITRFGEWGLVTLL